MSNQDKLDPFDLAVIGGGPAGAATALRAARMGLRIALFEPQEDGHDKPCGEGMMASGLEALESLGVDDLQECARPFASIRYLIPGAEPMEVDLPRPGTAMVRTELQLRLDSLLDIEAQVTRFTESVRLREGDGLHELTCENGPIFARTVVVADGGGGTNAAWMRSESSNGDRFGVRARFTQSGPINSVEVHMGGACEIYLTPLPGGLVNVAALFDETPPGARGAAAWLEYALRATPGAAQSLGQLYTQPGARSLNRRKPHALAEKGVFLVGDAGGGIDPILGCGVTLALRSGIAAAEAVQRIVAGEVDGAPERDYSATYRKETGARRALAYALRRAAPYPFLLRPIAAMGRVFPRSLSPLVRIVSGDSSAA